MTALLHASTDDMSSRELSSSITITITLGDFMHNYPEISKSSPTNNNENNFNSASDNITNNVAANDDFIDNSTITYTISTSRGNNSGAFHDDYCTTRSINLIRNIPFSEELSSLPSSSFSSSLHNYADGDDDDLVCNNIIANATTSTSEENYLDDSGVELLTTNTSTDYYFISPASSIVDLSSSIEDTTNSNNNMPIKSTSYPSFEDFSSKTSGNEDDAAWMCLLFQDGLRMMLNGSDSTTREWLSEQVDFSESMHINNTANTTTNNTTTTANKKSSSTDKIKNISLNLKHLHSNIDWSECKYATSSSTIEMNSNKHFVKSNGCLHYYKPSQPFTKKTSRLRKGLMDIVSSDNFGMTSMFVCPPLILAHWYAVYRKESVELNSAKYLESEWVFNNEDHCLERVAILKNYPKSIQKTIKRYSQQELDSHFPRRIVTKRIAYDYIRNHGFTFDKVKSNIASTTTTQSGGKSTFTVRCGSEILIEFISSSQFCNNMIKLFTFLSASLISRTLGNSVSILCEQLLRQCEEEPAEPLLANNDVEMLTSSPDGQAILYQATTVCA